MSLLYRITSITSIRLAHTHTDGKRVWPVATRDGNCIVLSRAPTLYLSHTRTCVPHTHIYICICTCRPECIHTCNHTCLHNIKHAYEHAHPHTATHTHTSISGYTQTALARRTDSVRNIFMHVHTQGLHRTTQTGMLADMQTFRQSASHAAISTYM